VPGGFVRADRRATRQRLLGLGADRGAHIGGDQVLRLARHPGQRCRDRVGVARRGLGGGRQGALSSEPCQWCQPKAAPPPRTTTATASAANCELRARMNLLPAGGRAGPILACPHRRRAAAPPVQQHLAHGFAGGHPQLDEDRGVAIEVRDGEKPLRRRRQQRFLLVQIDDPDGQDLALRNRLAGEPFDVGLCEWPFPCEALFADVPGPVSASLRLDGSRKTSVTWAISSMVSTGLPFGW